MNLFLLTATGLVGLEIKKYGDRFWPRAEKYWPAIKKAAIQNKISPYLLASILYKESRFNPRAVGSAGEIGMGQFKAEAAEDVNINYDLLADNPDLQIEAAARLLKLNERRSGSMFISVRAYNVGIGKATKDPAAGINYAVDIYKNMYVGALYHGLKGIL